MGISGKFVFRNKLLKAVAGTSALLAAGFAQSAENESAVAPLLQEVGKTMEFSGFLSVRGAQIQEDGIKYEARYDDQWTFSEDSVFGLQANASVSSDISVSMQITATSGDDPVELAWAYLAYAFDPDLTARFGRLRAPGFMLSEYLDVGYAYPWVQTPVEAYAWLPFSRYEGADLLYTMRMGDADVRLNPYAGTSSGQTLNLGGLRYTDQSSQFGGLDVQTTFDMLTLRAGYSKYKFELRDSVWDDFIGQAVNGTVIVPDLGPYGQIPGGVKLPGFIDFIEDVMVDGILQDLIDNPALRDFAGVTVPEEVLRAEQASLQAQIPFYEAIPGMDGDFDGSFAGIGFNLDTGSYQVMSEISQSKIGGVYPDFDSGYIMFAYRFGNWMPHLTLAKMYTIDDDERPDIEDLALNPAIWRATATSPLNQVADGAATYSDVLRVANDLVQASQESVTLGLRWDPLPGIALKAEVFRVFPMYNGYGLSFPGGLLDSAVAVDASLDDINLGNPPDNIDGMRMSLDAVF